MKLSSTKLKVFGGWIVVLMCIMVFSSKLQNGVYLLNQVKRRFVNIESARLEIQWELLISLSCRLVLVLPKLMHKIHRRICSAFWQLLIVMKRGIMVSTRLILIPEIILSCMT